MCEESLRTLSDLPILCDPMCGSGTIPIEAALIAADTAPGLLRYAPPGDGKRSKSESQSRSIGNTKEEPMHRLIPNPLRWVDLADTVAPLWKALWDEAVQRDQRAVLKKTGAAPCILGNDIHAGSINLARQAAANAGVQHMIQFSTKDVADFHLPRPVNLYVTNPPWDHRLDGAADAATKLREFANPAVTKQSTLTPQVPFVYSERWRHQPAVS